MCIALALTGCGSDDGGGTTTPTDDGDDVGPEEVTATYRLSITTNFTADTHPTDFPENAMFGPLFGVAHSNATVLFRQGQLSSDGFIAYVGQGDTGALSTELSPADDGDTGGNNTVVNITTASAIGASTTTSIDVTIGQSTRFISFAAALAPSPDWFIGVDSFDILGSDGLLIENSGTIELFPLDAGFNSGITYLDEGGNESSGVAPIVDDPFLINDPVSGIDILNPLATLTITRIN